MEEGAEVWWSAHQLSAQEVPGLNLGDRFTNLFFNFSKNFNLKENTTEDVVTWKEEQGGEEQNPKNVESSQPKDIGDRLRAGDKIW